MTSSNPVSISMSISSSSSSLLSPSGIRHGSQYSLPFASDSGTRTWIGAGLGCERMRARVWKSTTSQSSSMAVCAATESAQMLTSSRGGGGLIGRKNQKWWEKGLQPNMIEVKDAQHLVDSLLNAGDKLVILDFFSPGCGGCKSLHPKICQLAEMNPDVQFLQVNYEEHKSMCYSLGVHVLPFFRFYRGAQGRLCSFSCTNATIKKFKDALAKHSPERCSLGPTKGLEEKELLALAANKDLSFNYVPQQTRIEEVEASSSYPLTAPPTLSPIRLGDFSHDNQEDKNLATMMGRS